MASPFPQAWWSFELPGCRPCDGTYQIYPHESLPPLDERMHQGRFQWLGASGASEGSGKVAPRVAALQDEAARAGLTLPGPFVRFMSEPGLQSQVPSCTACEWDLSASLVPCKIEPGAFTIRFLRDQQDCLFWYLYLAPGAKGEVLCSPIPFDDPELDLTREVILANTWRCAPDFESFVHRFWLENALWEALEGDPSALTPEQKAYVAHYENAPRA